jgi:hypothetical protein
VHQYLPGQRRVKLAPEIAFDTPSQDGSGNFTYDETWVYNGSMERYNWKIVGKKEVYIPYNCYKALFETKNSELYKPKFMNPDVVRWELHRVWVVEATLKPGKRHVYPKRVIYVDEDSWAPVAAEMYDSNGIFYKVDYLLLVHNYELMAPLSISFVVYNLINGCYVAAYMPSPPYGYVKDGSTRPTTWWAPNQLAGSGLR